MTETRPAHPGGYIRDAILKPHKLTVTAAAEALRVSRVALSRLLTGDADLSGDMAFRLEKAFGVSAEWLLQMQFIYDLAEARQAAKTIDVPRYRRVS
jgi:addiction module HigA family antidote